MHIRSGLHSYCSIAIGLAAAIDEWEGSVEKEFSAVVRQLPKADSTSRLECPVCLSSCPRQRDGWVVFPCNHGVCSRCFQHLIDTQVRHDFDACPSVAIHPSVAR